MPTGTIRQKGSEQWHRPGSADGFTAYRDLANTQRSWGLGAQCRVANRGIFVDRRYKPEKVKPGRIRKDGTPRGAAHFDLRPDFFNKIDPERTSTSFKTF